MPRENSFQPLKGLRVIELGHFVAGPNLGSLLALYGAEVIKVEPPQGDVSLKTAPWAYHSFNLGKKDVCLDLLRPEGYRIFQKLVGVSDILVENLSPESVEKLGVDYEKVAAVNPRLIYCSIKGFAGDSPDRRRLAFDTVAQAEGGMMATTGVEGAGFVRVNNPLIDMGAAAYGLAAILLALMERARSGRGLHIEIPLLEVAVYWNSYWISYYTLTGKEPERLGAGHSGYSPYGVYRTRDGHIFIGVITDEQWVKLCNLLSIARIPGLDEMRQRIEKRAEVDRLVEGATCGFTTEELVAKLSELVPVARVRSIGEIASDGELLRRGVLSEHHVDGKRLRTVTPPMVMNGSRPRLLPKTIATGLHTREVLGVIGVGGDEIERLAKLGVIRQLPS